MRRGWAALLAASVTACGGAPPPAPLAPKAKPVSAPADLAFADRAWGAVSSERFFLELPLPESQSWTIDDRSGRWLVAVNVPTKSMIWIRAWREGSVMTHGACEAVARPWRRDLFGPDAASLVDRRSLAAPDGFDTEVGFSVRRSGNALGGVAVAVGARFRNCLVMAYATRAEGAGAELAVADRLSFVAERIFGRARNRTIDDRVGPSGRPPETGPGPLSPGSSGSAR